MDLILWRHADAEDGSPDSARKLSKRGLDQAAGVAAWLKPRLPDDCEILVSPATRAQQTALALKMPFVTSAKVGVDARTADILAAIEWPTRSGAALVVGHQPTLGRVAARLLTDRDADWKIAKGAVWWFRHEKERAVLFAVMHPKLA